VRVSGVADGEVTGLHVTVSKSTQAKSAESGLTTWKLNPCFAKILNAAARRSFKYARSFSTSPSNLGGVARAARSALLSNPKSSAPSAT
jgi:hypothetical protein